MNKEIIQDFVALAEERKTQKLRGLNNYNVLTAVRNTDAEVGMHSNFLYSLLDPNGDHYQGDLFVKLFIKYVLEIPDFGENIKVIPEYATSKDRRIDFVIKSDTYIVGIEMKIGASDLKDQISDYYKEIENKAEKVKMYYLTPTGKKASESSHRNITYKTISFEKHILNWLNKAQEQVANITNLNNAIEYYRDVVKMVTGKYRSPLYDYKTFFLDKVKGKERYIFFKDTEFKIFKNQSLLLTQKEWDDEVKMIESDFEKTKEKLYTNFYSRIFKTILDENRLTFFRYIQSKTTQELQFTFNDHYSINIFLNNEHNKFTFLKLGIAWAYHNDARGDKVLKKKLQKYGNQLKEIKVLDILVSGKGIKLESDHNLLKPSIGNLFLAQTKEIDILEGEIVIEIQKYINTTKDMLNDI